MPTPGIEKMRNKIMPTKALRVIVAVTLSILFFVAVPTNKTSENTEDTVPAGETSGYQDNTAETERIPETVIETKPVPETRKETETIHETEPTPKSEEEIRAEYIASCQAIGYDKIMQDPDTAEGSHVIVEGTVIKSWKLWFGFGDIALHVDDGKNIWYVIYGGDDDREIKENDQITVYGKCDGTMTYSPDDGENFPIPKVKAEYFDLIPAPEPTRLYDENDITIRSVKSGIGGKKIGEYSILKATSEEVTDEYLVDWYTNHVKANNYNWCMILYSDKSDLSGVYARYTAAFIEKNCTFWVDENGDYAIDDSPNAEYYIVDEAGNLKPLTNNPESTATTEPEPETLPPETMSLASEISDPVPETTSPAISEETEKPVTVVVPQETNSATVYVLNTNTKKIHYKWCGSVDEIKDENRATTTDYAQAIAAGYEPCKRCNP